MMRRIGILKHDRGVSIIELLVGIAVFALLIVTVDTVFSTAHRSSQAAELTAEVNQNVRIAVERLSREIRESAASEIQIDPADPGSLIFRSARPSDAGTSFCLWWNSDSEPMAVANPDCPPVPNDPLRGTYLPRWQRWIGYYYDATSREIRRVDSTSALSFPLAGSPGEKVLATDIDQLTMVKSGSSPARFSITVEGEGVRTVQGSPVPPQQILLDVTVWIRN